MLKFSFNLVFFLSIIINSGVVAQSTPELVFPSSLQGSIKFELSANPNSNKEKLDYDQLAVYVKNSAEEYGSNPIQGQHIREGNYLIFKPYFPFESGMIYVARTKKNNSHSDYSFHSFQIGKKKKIEESKIISIYPTASQLPENLLRFYIYFNTPMKKGEALKHIQLTDEAGNVDNHTFMEFKQELWSSDDKRLTILFDPGRIKRGVTTNIKEGPALIEGKRYKLSISGTWQDVYGQKLSTKTTKEFEVINAYRHHMKVADWVVNKPRTNNNDTLTIHFDRILDHALIQSMFKLEDEENNLMDGYWEILEKEQLVQFIPKYKWEKGNYRIVIDGRLEDISGNNLQNLLDHTKTSKENNKKPLQYIKFKI